MTQTRTATCMLCDANCGLRVTLDKGRVTGVRGDRDDPFTRGHICPKAAAIGDLMDDPDRVRRPLRRVGDKFEEVGWEEALEEIADRVAAIRRRHGPDAFATYLGNPTVHDYGAALAGYGLRMALGGRNHFSAISIDNLPRMVASQTLYGIAAATPVPDIERTDLLVIVGSNPLVSNGSGMVSPDIRNRLKEIADRGRLVVLDPRRTETAKLATDFHFVRPGTDALVVLAMIEHLFREGHADRSRAVKTHGDANVSALREAAAAFPAEAVASATGMDAGTIRQLAEDLANTPRAAIYGRMGTCVQRQGAATTMLLDLFNALADNLDHEGGVRFATPAADLLRLGAFLPKNQHLGVVRSRVDGLPGFLGELPVAAMLTEMETPGEGQIRGLLLHAGNPVTSNPSGDRLVAALEKLELIVAVDMYVGETTRHAHFILPTPVGLERPHYPMLLAVQGIRNFASYHPAVVPPPPGVRDSFELLLDIGARVASRSGLSGKATSAVLRGLRRLTADRVVDLLLRIGPYKTRLATIAANEHTTDLGPLQARLGEILSWKRKKVPMFPVELAGQIPALAKLRDAPVDELVLISRRTLRSNNSWMHNIARLQKGASRCTLEMSPTDAEARELEDGGVATVASTVGSIEVPVLVTDRLMPGVVCLPHGFGQQRAGDHLKVASAVAGVSINDVIDRARVDPISGTSALNGQPVTVTRA